MQQSPFISIIIPLYNKEKYIRETLQSCVNQDYDNYEILIIDDGSKDGSAEIVKSFSCDKIRYVLQENAGVSTARNNGAKLAKGEWLLMLDADDTILPDALALYSQAVNNRPEAKIIIGKEWKSNIESSIKRRVDVANISLNPYNDFRKKRFFPAAGLALLHSSVMKQVQYEPKCRFYEDILFYLTLMRQFRPWAWFEVPMFRHPQEVRGLSMSPHPIEVEGAYFLKPQKFESMSEAFCYMELVGNCQWWRNLQGDYEGAAYYEQRKKELFTPWQIFCYSLVVKIKRHFKK